MITLEQIALAINEMIISVFPDVEIQSTDISEGFNRPSFFVDFEASTNSSHGARGRERRIQVTVYYFPSDRYQNRIELLEVQEKLEAAFTGSLMITEGFVVYPFDVDTVKVDGTLQTSFEIYYIEVDATDDGEDMGDLQLNVEKRD